MQKKLWFIRPVNFQNDETGEVINGAKICLLGNVPFEEPDYGYSAEIIWIGKELRDTLIKDIKGLNFPIDVELTIEDSLTKKPKVKSIRVIK